MARHIKILGQRKKHTGKDFKSACGKVFVTAWKNGEGEGEDNDILVVGRVESYREHECVYVWLYAGEQQGSMNAKNNGEEKAILCRKFGCRMGSQRPVIPPPHR
ncbi:hypothetical protein LXL04_011919 [Taraxacum kok-saghyz]